MIAVRMVQLLIDEIVDVIPVRYRLVSTARTMLVAWLVAARAGLGGALRRMLTVHRDLVLVDVIAVGMVQMAVVQVVGVALVPNCDMPAIRSVLVIVMGMGVVIVLGHCHNLWSGVAVKLGNSGPTAQAAGHENHSYPTSMIESSALDSPEMSGLTHDWVSDAEQALAEAGYRRGGARRAVLELLAAQSCALSALEIEDLLRGRERRVSRASIYRILEELEGLGAVQRVDIGQGLIRYEAVGRDRTHHHHLVCDQCGALQPFSDPELERTIKRVSRRLPATVSDHEVVLHGACTACTSE